MPAVILSPIGGAGEQFFDNNGVVLSGGLIYTYAAGTTTPLATYTNSTGSTAHANPVVLNAAGRVAGDGIWLAYGSSYKFVIKTSAGVTIATYDNITGSETSFPSADSVTTLAATTGMTDGDWIVVENWGWYQYDSSSVATANGYIVVAPNVGSGRWIMMVDGRYQRGGVTVNTFGAVGDGSTDDATAIQAAANYCATNGIPLIFPSGTYIAGTKITLSSAITIIGYGATLKLKNATNTGLLRIGATEGTSSQVSGVRILGLTLDGNKANQTNASTGTLSAVVATLETYNLDSPIVRDVTIKNSKGVGWKCWGDDGSGSGLASNTLATGLYIYAPSGTGLLMANTKLGRFSDIFIQDAGNIGMEVVNDHTVAATCEEFVVSNLHIHNSTGVGLAVYSGVVRVQFSNVQLTLNAGGGMLWGANDPYGNQIANNGVVSGVLANFLIRKGGSATGIGLQIDRGSKNTFTGFHITDHDTSVYLANTVRNQFVNFTFITAATLHINCVSGAVDNAFNSLFFAHPASSNNYINVNSGATGNTFLGIDDYDVSKIAVNSASTDTGFGNVTGGRTATSTPVTASVEDQRIITNLSVAGAVAVSLPANPEPYRPYTVVDGKGDAAANNITITPASGTISGAATVVINANYGNWTGIHDGTNWFTVD